MSDDRLTHLSKFLSYVLRHAPESIGVALDAQGWVAIDTLLEQSRLHGRELSRPLLEEVVARNAKRRFAISEDGLRIRASQGHSVSVELEYPAVPPPELLFHGTVEKFLPAIRVEGLRKMDRHHVHLSQELATAQAVGARRGKAVILTVEAGKMHREGARFHLSANGVWLTDAVAPRHLRFPERDSSR